ncbi:MAG TPA: hypothetical protein VKA08_02865 [Balneolales bacterium]|nr:hypothetical protein [Balneolales bacterium]
MMTAPPLTAINTKWLFELLSIGQGVTTSLNMATIVKAIVSCYRGIAASLAPLRFSQ